MPSERCAPRSTKWRSARNRTPQQHGWRGVGWFVSAGRRRTQVSNRMAALTSMSIHQLARLPLGCRAIRVFVALQQCWPAVIHAALRPRSDAGSHPARVVATYSAPVCHPRKDPFRSPQAFLPLSGSRFDRIGQPLRGSYSPSLPLFRSPCALPRVTVTAEVPHLDPRYYARLAVGSCYFAWPCGPTPNTNKRISGAKDSKNAPVLRIAIITYRYTTASRTHRSVLFGLPLDV